MSAFCDILFLKENSNLKYIYLGETKGNEVQLNKLYNYNTK